MSDARLAFRLKALAAFAAVYLIWGSTYLAIRFAIETLPGFSMAGIRFVVAGAVLVAAAAISGAGRPTARHWANAALIGFLLLVCGNGSVVWAEQRVPSGLAALLIGTEPLFIASMLWFLPGGDRPGRRTVLALLIGFAGAALLALAAPAEGEAPLHLPSVAMLLFACVTWAAGSLYARKADAPSSALWGTGIQMLTGGAMLLLIALVTGEWRQIHPEAVSERSAMALLYLIVAGSIVGYTAYTWLVRNVRPTLVATYAYVNPVVAVLLGWAFAGEPIGPTTIFASVLIIGAVVLASMDRTNSQTKPLGELEESPAEAEPALVPALPAEPVRKCA